MVANSVIFTATHRSGSTLLTELIRKIDLIGRPGELFYARNIADMIRREGLEPTPIMEEWLPTVIREGSSPNGAFSAKIFADNFKWLAAQCSQSPWPDAIAALPGFFEKHFPGAVFVDIRRKNKIAQGISLLKALQTGIWHSNHFGRVKARTPYYQRELIQWAIANIEQQEADLDEILARLGIQPLRIYYEDYTRDIPGTLKQIFALAGRELPPAPLPESNLSRLSNTESEHWLHRFLEEEEFFQTQGQPVLELDGSPVFEINISPPQRAILPGTKEEVRFEVISRYHNRLKFVGRKDHPGAILLKHSTWDTKTGELVDEQPLPVPRSIDPDEGTQLHFHWDVPKEPGEYELRVTCFQIGVGQLPVTGAVTTPIKVSATFEQSIREVFGPFQQTADSWYYADWFGHFDATSFPWILSLDHGWLNLRGNFQTEGGPTQFYDSILGEWSTTSASYPEIVLQNGSRLKYLRTEEEVRLFSSEDGGIRTVTVSQIENQPGN